MNAPIDTIRQRLRPDRPMTIVALPLPQDVVEELRRLAIAQGFSSEQALIRACLGRYLREHDRTLIGDPPIPSIDPHGRSTSW